MVGLVGLNSVGAFPTLQNPFTPANQLALRQQANSYSPAAEAQLPLIQVPSAAETLAQISDQTNYATPRHGGAAPNSSTPPAQAGGGGGSSGGPMSWQELLNAFTLRALGQGGSMMGTMNPSPLATSPFGAQAPAVWAPSGFSPNVAGSMGLINPPPAAPAGQGLLG